MATRLTPAHPHHQSLERLWALMDELDIQIQPEGVRTFVVIEGQRYDLEDTDREPVAQFPPETESMIVRDRL